MELKITRISLIIASTLVGAMWLIHMANLAFDWNLYQLGIYPGKWSGLVGIIAAPFVHSTADFGHIINNSVPAFILTALLFYHYRTIAAPVFILIYLITGLAMWLLARESYHIGMSGVIYGLSSFLVASGFFRKNMRVAAVSLFVIFLYGSMVWGIFPTAINVSWEGHALGLFSGIIVAVIYKKSGPQPKKLLYEIQEDLGIEPEHDFWKPEEELTQAEKNNEIVIKYEYTETKKSES